MKRSFSIDQTIAISGESFYYDLHNCYNFQFFIYDAINKKLELVFSKARKDNVKKEDPENLKMTFVNPKFFQLSENFLMNKQSTITEIGFKRKNDTENSGAFIDEKKSLKRDHMIIYFDEDDYLRVYAESVELHPL